MIYLGFLTATLYRVHHELREGQAVLADVTLTEVNQAGGVGPVADRAARHLAQARRAAHSATLAPLSVLPGIGSQVGALRDLTATTDRLGRLARTSADEIQRRLDSGGASSGNRIALLDTADRSLRQLRRGLADTTVGAHGWLVPPLADARRTLVHKLQKTQAKLAGAAATVRAMGPFLGKSRPHRVLILAANNDEMRGGGGMPLSAGVAFINKGHIDVSDFVETSNLYLGNGPVGHLPQATLAAYGPSTGGFAIGQEWRETNVTPNFPTVAPVYARMARARGLGHVDGVMVVDAYALAALVAVTGPVKLGGVTYTAQNVIPKVFYENYLKYNTLEQRPARVDLQSRLAKRVFDSFDKRPVSATLLAQALLRLAEGRHVLAWSSQRQVQAAWKRLGVSGAVRADSLLVSVENITASKLDYFLRPRIAMKVAKDRRHQSWKVTLAVTIDNYERKRTSGYIEGGTAWVKSRDYRTYLDVHLPGDAYAARDLGRRQAARAVQELGVRRGLADDGVLSPGFTLSGHDPPSAVVGTRYIVPYRTTRTVVISFRLPAIDDHVVVLPSGRLLPQPWDINGTTYYDAAKFRFDFPRD